MPVWEWAARFGDIRARSVPLLGQYPAPQRRARPFLSRLVRARSARLGPRSSKHLSRARARSLACSNATCPNARGPHAPPRPMALHAQGLHAEPDCPTSPSSLLTCEAHHTLSCDPTTILPSRHPGVARHFRRSLLPGLHEPREDASNGAVGDVMLAWICPSPRHLRIQVLDRRAPCHRPRSSCGGSDP
jgi:hypothetical protein